MQRLLSRRIPRADLTDLDTRINLLPSTRNQQLAGTTVDVDRNLRPGRTDHSDLISIARQSRCKRDGHVPDVIALLSESSILENPVMKIYNVITSSARLLPVLSDACFQGYRAQQQAWGFLSTFVVEIPQPITFSYIFNRCAHDQLSLHNQQRSMPVNHANNVAKCAKCE